MQVASFITAFVIAYVKLWRLALALSGLLPAVVITGGGMSYFLVKWQQ